MSIEQLLETLKDFGLNRTDAKVYIHLAKQGPSKARVLSNELKLAKQQLYPCLRKLQKSGIVFKTQGHPAVFHALPYEGVIAHIIELKINEAENAKTNSTL